MRATFLMAVLCTAACSTPGSFTESREPKVLRTSRAPADVVACVMQKADRFRPRPNYEPIPNGLRLSAVSASGGASTTFWVLDVTEGEARLFIRGKDADLEKIVADCV